MNKKGGFNTEEKNKAVLKLQKAARKKNSTKKKQKALVKINKATVKMKRKQEACPICLEKITKKDRVETKCGHFFHKKCLQGWCIQKVKDDKNCVCPLCKTDLLVQTREAKKKLKEEEKKLEKMFESYNDETPVSPGRLQRIATIEEQGRLELIRINERLANTALRREELREERRRRRVQREAAQNPTQNPTQNEGQ